MMETNFTRKSYVVRFLTVLLISLWSMSALEAQSCACKQSVQISIGDDGSAEVTAAMLLADGSTCAGTQTVTVMLTPTGSPIPGSPFIDCSYAGKTLYGKVNNGNNSCWSTLVIEDKVKPVITCPTRPLTMTCAEMSSFKPNVSDNCAVARLDTVNEVITVNNCNNGFATNILKQIVRTYRAVDVNGNISEPCIITFNVTTLASLSEPTITYPVNYDIAPGNNDALQCDEPYAKLENGNPSPTNKIVAGVVRYGTGTPKVGAIDLYNNADLYCGLMVTYSDSPPIKIKCTTKIMRTWQVIEWSCRNIASVNRVQVLEITDNQGPSIASLTNIVASTSNHNCTSNVTFANPILDDNCASKSSLTADITIYPNGDLLAPGIFIKHGASKTVSLPVGAHVAIYTAYDACYNSTTANINVEVEDNTPPVTICDELATVGLTTDGTAWVPASVFDDGSYDECKLEKFLVRRMNTTSCAPCETPTFPGFKLLGSRDGHYYYASEHKLIGKTAFKMAKAMGGYAVSIETKAEGQWLIDKLDENNLTDCYSIGLNINNYSTYPDFKWESGANFNYNDFFGSLLIDSNIDYICINGSSAINNIPNYAPNKYIIEITDPCGWSSYAQFCCEDVPANQMVAFRSIDASGNFNDCMVSAVIQDKIGPKITCPEHMTVSCDFAYDPNNLRKDFGWPVATDNCENPTISQDSTISINSCRIGNITRTFTVTDRGGRTASCTQIITFAPDSDQIYNGPTANQWPDNITVKGCGDPNAPEFLPAVAGLPQLTDGACSLVGAQYVDETYSFNNPSSPACFKILRKWTVIDWCQPIMGGGYRTFTHTQEIKVIDDIAPVFGPLAPSVSADTQDANCASGQITLVATASDVCTTVLKWSYKIYPNNGAISQPVVSGTGNTIDASGTYPVGVHKIVYTFEDKCGNVSSKEQLFSIINKKEPSAYVKQGLAMSLMKIAEGEGMAEIWATDFDNGSSHPCGYPVLLSFTKVTLNAQGQMVGTPNLVFDCDNLDEPQSVTIWVAALTPAGDIVQTSVTTFIDIQDNNGICPDMTRLTVNGVLATEANASLENAYVELIGSEQNRMTDKNGSFDFSNMPQGGQYSVLPSKNDDALNGVSTLDLVMIQRHILGLDNLNSPYKLIAADVNKDGKITASDLTELRKLILGTNAMFTNNKSWRFVDKAYTFTEPKAAEAESFPETYNIDELNSSMKTDFVAVKIGDVNGNVKANNANSNVESRSSNKLELTTMNTEFEGGDKVIIPIDLARSNEFSGIQFTFNFDSELLSLIAVDPAKVNVNDSNFGFANIQDGILTFSWNDVKGKKLDAESTLFNLTFLAKDKGNIANSLSINSQLTVAEAYTENSEVMSVNLSVKERANDRGFVLYQNAPNPFKVTTIIGFELPEAMNASLTVYDVTGKVISVDQMSAVKGYNSFEINKNNLKAGVMYYSLIAGEYKATKKMVVIE